MEEEYHFHAEIQEININLMQLIQNLKALKINKKGT